MSLLRRAIPSALIAATVFLFIPGRAAEPDPKAICFTLPDNIVWKKGASLGHGDAAGRSFQAGYYTQLLRWHAAQYEPAALS